MWPELLLLAAIVGLTAFAAYWRGYNAAKQEDRWVRQELHRAERIAEIMRDAAFDAELELLTKGGK